MVHGPPARSPYTVTEHIRSPAMTTYAFVAAALVRYIDAFTPSPPTPSLP
ncbi:hypothetical protein CBM2606_A140139 [Cupriavidus taiwanensis]|nr:hypothetical protein CBM2606_A140139 [Cupriavidus taiwanensis]